DNSEGRIGGQWGQYAELSIKRLLARDGDSSYYINNIPVRRRDIYDLFLGTGLGPRAYAIIEQGMISRVVEAKPEDLRIFLEEAAGVSKYRERRKETEGRLSDTRENLARVEDIRLELGNQLTRLEQQAKVATEYRELEGRLKQSQQMLWLGKKQDAARARERAAGEIAALTTALDALQADVRAAEASLESLRVEHYSAGAASHEKQGAVYAANAEGTRLQQQHAFAQIDQDARVADTRGDNIARNLEQLASRREKLTTELAELAAPTSAAISEVEEQLAQESADLAGKQSAQDALAITVQSLQDT